MPTSEKIEAADTWRPADGFYRDSRLEAAGVVHGVTTRALGNMKESLSRENALKRAGAAGRPLLLRQMHGTEIHGAFEFQDEAPRGDGWISAGGGERRALCVYVADCLPIFVWDAEARAAAGVFHAGWRGLASGMGCEAVRAFGRRGLKPGRLAASVGPHIGACCYRVGAEVAEKFHPEVRHPKVSEDAGQWIDLGAEAWLQLTEAGIDPDRIAVSRACTSCRPDEFFSYRRERKDQRMMAFIQHGDGNL